MARRAKAPSRSPQEEPYLITREEDGAWTFHRLGESEALLLRTLARSGEVLPWDPRTLLVIPGADPALDSGWNRDLPPRHPLASPIPIRFGEPLRGLWPPGAWRCRRCAEPTGVVPMQDESGLRLANLACWCQTDAGVGYIRAPRVHREGAWWMDEDGALHWADRQTPPDPGFPMSEYRQQRKVELGILATLQEAGLEPPLGPCVGLPPPDGPLDTWTFRWLRTVILPLFGQSVSMPRRQAVPCT